MSSDPSSEALPGERIGRYTVVRRLAVGGMAEVYLARHEGPKGFAKLVVIKRVLPGLDQADKFLAMFLDEGRLAARLSHPNIAQTFELGDHEGTFHIVMEYVPGESLARLVKRAGADEKPIPEGVVLRVVMQVLEALDYAHDLKGDHGDWLKVVHRDVSPTNVIITYHGAVKLLDFGIARSATHEHHTQIGTVKGKGGYMSPEQALGSPIDQRTDIYAVGSLLYLLTTGVGPFDSLDDVFAMIRAAIDGRFQKPSALSPAVNAQLEKITLKAMAQKAEDRYPTAAAMLADLEDYAASQRLFPSARSLTAYMRQLFPERVELSRSYDQAPDDSIVAKLAESFSDVDSRQIVGAPTKLARRVKGEDGTAMTVPSVPIVRSGLVLASKAARPIVKVVGLEERPPMQALRGRIGAGESSDELTEAAPRLLGGLAGFVGAVPELSRHSSERATQLQLPPVVLQREEATTAAVPIVGGPDGPFVSLRTASGEQEITGAAFETADSTMDLTQVPPPARSISLTNMVGVGNLVANNPWAFVIAGLAAVLFGVAVLWVLGGD